MVKVKITQKMIDLTKELVSKEDLSEYNLTVYQNTEEKGKQQYFNILIGKLGEVVYREYLESNNLQYSLGNIYSYNGQTFDECDIKTSMTNKKIDIKTSAKENCRYLIVSENSVHYRNMDYYVFIQLLPGIKDTTKPVSLEYFTEAIIHGVTDTATLSKSKTEYFGPEKCAMSIKDLFPIEKLNDQFTRVNYDYRNSENDLRIANTEIYGLENAVRCSKFPMQVDLTKVNYEITRRVDSLAKTSIGEGHDNFLNGIIVQFDITATNKFWTEFQRYHFADFISSQSTMHRITKFNLEGQYSKYTDERVIKTIKELVGEYNDLTDKTSKYAKDLYLTILYSNPAGFKLTAGITTNYRQLKTMYAQRKNHRLPEWIDFCYWIKGLPHSEWITGGN